MSRAKIIATIALLVSGLAVTAGSSASAVTAWHPTSPTQPLWSTGAFAATSCAPASTTCTAVGTYTGRDGATDTLIESWSAAKWVTMASPNPGAIRGTSLTGVSCPTTLVCMASGSYTTASGVVVPLVLQRSGSAWTQVSIPFPASAISTSLAGISCPTTAFCVSVGTTDDGTTPGHQPFVLVDRGGVWTQQTIPDIYTGMLSGVSCYSATACAAVGTDQDGSVFAHSALALKWDGATWTTTSPISPGTFLDELDGVSCPTSNFCAAVGFSSTLDGPRTNLVEAWNGSSWSLRGATNPGASNQLSSVSCSSASACAATGQKWGDNTGPYAVLERLSAGSFVATTIPFPSGSLNTNLPGVDCPVGHPCFVGGWLTAGANDAPLPYVISGSSTSWARLAPLTPVGAGSSELMSVSCPAVGSCIAVGEWLTAAGDWQGLIETEKGSGWTGKNFSVPGMGNSGADAISCGSVHMCMAIGWQDAEPGTISDLWNGTTWTQKPTAPGDFDGFLAGVSCVGTAFCTAVGQNLFTNKPLIETWNGSVWKLISSPSLGSATGELTGVSCASTHVCVAVGEISTTTTTSVLIETWNGASWTRQTFATDGTLAAISCPSTTTCFATGRTGSQWLALRGFANTWTPQTLPFDEIENSIDAISCPSTTSCTAVLGYRDPGKPNILTLTGATWSLQSTAPPPGWDPNLEAVSCVGAAGCVVVGVGGLSRSGETAAQYGVSVAESNGP